MRVGKWVPLYKRKLPVPQRLAMAFGLAEGSILHLVPITDEEDRHRHGFEIIVSPVPPSSWRSVCRLSVRLQDRPKALAIATGFLAKKRINILFSESASTITHRAHWDAVCDLSAMPAFSELANLPGEHYPRRMDLLLHQLSAELEEYMNDASNRKMFLEHAERHGQFTALTGLNNASFVCDFTASPPPCRYTAGGIEIPEKLANIVSHACLKEAPLLPEYAMITGNTEQRYLRVLFLRDYRSLFRIIVENETTDFAGGGIGVLHQLLFNLPPQVNLIRTSSRIAGSEGNVERGWTEIIAHWEDPNIDPEIKQGHIEHELKRVIPSTDIKDLDGKMHKNVFKVEYWGPETLYPRVFVSYSTRNEPSKLTYLLNLLWDNHFRPVLGTDMDGRRGWRAQKLWPSSVDIVESAFDAIRGCVALISLQQEHPEFKVVNPSGRSRYVLPPWAHAEEVYAWAHNIGRIIRIRQSTVEEPRYEHHLSSYVFDENDDNFVTAVEQAIGELNAFRATREFATVSAEARAALYQSWYPPGDV